MYRTVNYYSSTPHSFGLCLSTTSMRHISMIAKIFRSLLGHLRNRLLVPPFALTDFRLWRSNHGKSTNIDVSEGTSLIYSQQRNPNVLEIVSLLERAFAGMLQPKSRWNCSSCGRIIIVTEGHPVLHTWFDQRWFPFLRAPRAGL